MDTSNRDIKAVIDQLACIAWKKPVKSHGVTVYKGGPCPFCHQGTDRFAVFPEGDKPHFYCGIHGNGCGAHGDAITFVQLLKGYSSQGSAIRDLQEMGFQVGDGTGGICRERGRISA
jgi:DNA primase